MLQLVVNDGINSQRVVGAIIAKLKSCAPHFNHSVLAKQRLTANQKELDLPLHSIIQAVPTHWNSTLHGLDRMLEQKRALNVYAGNHRKISTLTADQWAIVSNLMDTLGPIKQVTLEMSKSDGSISSIIPSIAVLKMILKAEGPKTKGMKTPRDTMLNSLETRFEKAEKTKCLVLTPLLDPRYKGTCLSTGHTKQHERMDKRGACH